MLLLCRTACTGMETQKMLNVFLYSCLAQGLPHSRSSRKGCYYYYY